MSVNLGFLIVIGALIASGVYLILERSITKMLLGLILFGNGVNLLILTAGGPDGKAPIIGSSNAIRDRLADPLAQAMILTAIVITMGISAFVLALAYRSFTLTTRDQVENDPEDIKVAQRSSRADAPDQDRSDDPVTGEPSVQGDAFDAQGNPILLSALKNLEEIESYEDLRAGRFQTTYDPDDDHHNDEQADKDAGEKP